MTDSDGAEADDADTATESGGAGADGAGAGGAGADGARADGVGTDKADAFGAALPELEEAPTGFFGNLTLT